MAAISTTVLWIMAIFAVLGVIERIIKHWAPEAHIPLIDGFGQEMENGFNAMGASGPGHGRYHRDGPVLAKWLAARRRPALYGCRLQDRHVRRHVARHRHGRYASRTSACEGCRRPEWVGYFGGLLLGSVFGVNIVFNIPVGLGIIQAKDRKYMALGVLAGIIVAPFGALLQSILAGNPFGASLAYLVPVFIVAALIAAGLIFARDAMIKGFIFFGKFITSFILIGLGLVIFQTQTGVVILKGMAPDLLAHSQRVRGESACRDSKS